MDSLSNLKMPVKQFYERSGVKGADPTQLSVSPFYDNLEAVF